MGKSQRVKGHSFERWVANALRSYFPWVEAKRGWQSRGGGKEEPDVVWLEEFHIECKRGKKTNIKAAMAQAEEDMKHPAVFPVAITRDDRGKAYVTMEFSHWAQVITPYVREEAADEAAP